jgi:hypothetical protein
MKIICKVLKETDGSGKEKEPKGTQGETEYRQG